MKTSLLLLKTLSIFFFFSLFSFTAIGQIVIISKYPKKVPLGRKWVLTQQINPIVELDEHTLITGSYFNALIQSNPRVIGIIGEGEPGRPNILYQIEFRGLTKVAYANSLTYKLSGIIDFKATRISGSKSSTQSSLTFYPGQTVSVNDGLESIQLMQVPFTASEIAEISRNEKIQEANDRKQEASDLAQRKAEATADYKKSNEDIINGLEPLKQYDYTFAPSYEGFGLPTKLTYNENDLKYNIDDKTLLGLLDSLNINGRIFIQFDKKGFFKALFNEKHYRVAIGNDLIGSFKKAISLNNAMILTYNRIKYPVDFETKEFVVQKNDGYTYKQFAFTVTKTSIEFLNKSAINNALIKDVESKFEKTIDIVPLINSQENIAHLKDLILKKLSTKAYSTDRDFSYNNLVSGAKASFYKYHFQIKKNELVFDSQGSQYIVNSRTRSIGVELFKDWANKEENVGILIKNTSPVNEEIFNIFFFNRYRNAVEELHL